MKLKKEDRKKIVKEFVEHHGHFEPQAFVEFIRNAGPEHPAYAWFEWDDTAAAEEHRKDQARAFVRGLTIRYDNLGGGPKVVEGFKISAPLLLSPKDGRKDGGGYKVFDVNNDMPELRRQAADDLRSWLKRYSLAVVDAGISPQSIQSIIDSL